jgi:hypothetical protein
MLIKRLQVLIPLFDRMLRHSFFSAKREAKTIRSGGSRRYVGRRASTLRWTGTSPVEGWRRLGTVLGIAAIIASLATAANGAAAARVAVLDTLPKMDSSNEPLARFVDEAARRFDIPAAWIRAVMRVESNGNPIAVSPKGAMGLMQIMPKSWVDLCARYQLGADPFDPRDNILAGAAYLRELYNRFGEVGFLAAYNAGPTRFEDYLAGRRPLRGETMDYLAKLQRFLPNLHIGDTANAVVNVSSWRQAGLFSTSPTATPSSLSNSPDYLPTTSSPPPSFALTPQSSGLFVAIRTPPK